MTGAVVVALLAKTYPLFYANSLYFCQQFISQTIYKISSSLPGALIFGIWAALSLGFVSFFIQLVRTQLLIHRVISGIVPLKGKAFRIASALDLKSNTLLIEDARLYSFCFGLIHPKIAVTTGLVKLLSSKELEAVLLHERAHALHKDPLKILMGRTIATTFFFLPIFRALYRNMEATNELIADRITTETQNGSRYLQGALRKIIAHPQVAFTSVPAISHPDYMEIRIRQLGHPEHKHTFHISTTDVVTGLVFAGISLFLLQTPVNAFHAENTAEPSYFLCSVDGTCKQECHHTNPMSTMSSPHELQSKQTPAYSAPSYK